MKMTAIAAAACALVATSGYAATASKQTVLPQYDAFSDKLGTAATAKSMAGQAKLSRQAVAKAKKANVGPRGLQSHYDAKLGAHTFLWLANGKQVAEKASVSPLKRSVLAESVARSAVEANASVLGIGRSAIRNAKLADLQDDGKGLVIAKFQQRVSGRDVFNRHVAVLMDRQLTPKSVSGYFAQDKFQLEEAKSANFSRSAAEAISIAFRQMGGSVSPGALQVAGAAGDYSVYMIPSTDGYVMRSAPRVKEVFYPTQDRLVPAYYVELSGKQFDGGAIDQYGFVVAADSGEVLFRNNQVAYDAAFTYKVYADANGIQQPFDGPLGNDKQPVTAGPNGPFSRAAATQNSVTLVNGPIVPTTLVRPWLPTGASVTTGNNVNAYLDLNDYLLPSGAHGADGFDEGSSDVRGEASAANTFAYTYTPDADPTTPTQRQAAVANLFYMNNWLHDWWYHNGFDETAGNAQDDNFGIGGIGGDAIEAQGQDGTGTDNANMSTPADGGRPRMQMYLFTGPIAGHVTVNSPASIAGEKEFGVAAMGPANFDLTKDVAIYSDGTASPNLACNPATNAAALAGKIALVTRGTCNFTVKVKNAQDAGAAAVLIANNAAGVLSSFGGVDASITIPSMMVSNTDGAGISGAITGSETVNVRLQRNETPMRDGTMDNGIIAHEWFHYVSNRLIGDASGLYNQQGRGMGEGWSDFATLMLVVREEDRMVPGNDQWQGVYSTGTYVDDNQYFGIRRAPYSTDSTKNPLTFKHIEAGVHLPPGTYAPGTDLTGSVMYSDGSVGNAEVHNAGEIWANTLWELYAALLKDSRYTFAEAQDRMKSYVIAALKITPVAPTMLEARDALLAVASATDDQDFDLFAKAFAKHGMGYGAVAPDRYDDLNSGVVESFEPYGASFIFDSAAVDASYNSDAEGYCDTDNVLDVGETVELKLTIRSTGSEMMTTPITGKLVAPEGVTLPDGDEVTFTSLGLFDQTATASVLVKLDGPASTGEPLTFSVEFPEPETDDGIGRPDTAEFELAVNYDLGAGGRSDNMEAPLASLHDWTVADLEGTPLPGYENLPGWQITDAYDGLLHTGNIWYAPDNDGISDLTLTSPTLQVGAQPFTLSFQHRFQLEVAGQLQDGTIVGYDGAVIEISVDGGPWEDALTSEDVGGTVTTGAGYNGKALVFNGASDPADWRPAFVYRNGAFVSTAIDFGTKLAGHAVQIRFRERSDQSSGDVGWLVDNIAFTGINNSPFSVVSDNTGECAASVDAGPDQHVLAPASVTLHGSGYTLGGLTYQWTQTSGPAVSLDDPTSPTPSFGVTTAGYYTFKLTAETPDGRVLTDTTEVTSSKTVSSGKSGGGGAMGWMVLLLAPLALLRRRRKLH
ncbi:M36 family metallopeptidase [Solimonas variicoloris]|uniref:M36 family metallopeptidase n=1 Tax=Solimonas variicoloris TaxID=254408 RepID=UPI0003747579|nr:M36 family metallopeptidase [Solimonas variicoloris]